MRDTFDPSFKASKISPLIFFSFSFFHFHSSFVCFSRIRLERKPPFKGIRLSRLCNRAFYTRSITGTPLNPFNTEKKYLEPMFLVFFFPIFDRNLCNVKYSLSDVRNIGIFHFWISFRMLLQNKIQICFVLLDRKNDTIY